MERLHQNEKVKAAGLALLEAVREAYPGLLPDNVGIEVETARGVIGVRAVTEAGELAAAALPEPPAQAER